MDESADEFIDETFVDKPFIDKALVDEFTYKLINEFIGFPRTHRQPARHQAVRRQGGHGRLHRQAVHG